MDNILKIVYQKSYIKFLLLISGLIIILTNVLISLYYDAQNDEAIRLMEIDLGYREKILDERMAVMNKNFYLLREWIVEVLENEGDEGMLLPYFQYDSDVGISLLAEKSYKGKGNIIINGDFRERTEQELRRMSGLEETFSLMEIMLANNDYKFWSNFYTKNYIAMYPWEEVVESLGDVDVLFEGVCESIDLLSEDLDETLINEGWENGVFFDASGHDLLIQKGLPVIVGEELVGIVCSNTEITNVGDWLNISPILGRLMVIDGDDALVYDSSQLIESIQPYTVGFSEAVIETLNNGLNSGEVFKMDGYYYFSTKLDQINWRIIHQIPISLIEGNLLFKVMVYSLSNVILLLGVAFILFHAARNVRLDYEMAKQKDEFVMMVSHDLKTPLASIIGFNELIERKFIEKIVPLLEVDDQQIGKDVQRMRRNFTIINEEGERLTQSIRNILDLAKMKAGQLVLSYESVKIEELVEFIFKKLDKVAKEKGVALKSNFEVTEMTFSGDRYYISQLLMNLTENALKYTDEGAVSIDVKSTPEDMIFEVIDTGIGIEPSMLSEIMKPFVRAYVMDDKAGNGLGLSICSRIVEEHKGTIELSSTIGVGTKVRVVLPKRGEL